MQQKRHVLRLALEVPLFLARAAQNRTLVITGHPGEIAVTDTDGHSYVEIEALARLTNGSLSFNGNQIILTLPAASTPPSGSAPPATEPSVSGFSKDFIRASIEEMAVIRKWRSTLKNAVQQGFPVTEDWADNYRARAEQSLRLVSLAVSTRYDRNAFQLLTNEFKNMKKLSDRFVEAGKARIYVSPNLFNNDSLDKKSWTARIRWRLWLPVGSLLTMEHVNRPCRTTTFSHSTMLVTPTFSSLRISLAKLTVLSSPSPAQNSGRARTVPEQVVTERNAKGQAW